MITIRRTSMPVTPTARRKVRIDSLEVIVNTSNRRQLRLVLAWAELHDGLTENWRWARAGETLHEIDPLR